MAYGRLRQFESLKMCASLTTNTSVFHHKEHIRSKKSQSPIVYGYYKYITEVFLPKEAYVASKQPESSEFSTYPVYISRVCHSLDAFCMP